MPTLFNITRHFPLTTLCITAIWVLCFMDVPETPLNNVTLIDKWTHIAMYLGTGSVWTYESRNSSLSRCLTVIVCLWLMSGIIELGQAYCTNGRRSGEWLDFFANGTGCLAAAVVACIYHKMKG